MANYLHFLPFLCPDLVNEAELTPSKPEKKDWLEIEPERNCVTYLF